MFVGIRGRGPHSPRDRLAPAAFGVILAQATSPELNWWDGLVESWLNLPSWAQAAVAAIAIALVIALAVSLVLWVIAAVEMQRRMSWPTSIRHGWLTIPGWSKAVQIMLIGVVVVGAFTALSGRPSAELRVSPAQVTFGGVVSGGTATSDLTFTNLGTAGSPAIRIEQVTVSGEDAALFTVVSGADAVAPTGGDATVTIAFSPDSTGLKVADLQVVHSGSNSPTIVRLTGRGARVVRMNAGGREIDDSPTWTDDRAFLVTERTAALDDGGLQISLSHPSIPAGVPSVLFQSARVSETSSLAYDFPVEPGTYEVRLFFAELPDVVRSALMDVIVNGEAVVDQLNVADHGAAGAGLMVPIVVTSSLDTISVRIQSLLGSPWVNAIEIVDISQSSGSRLDAPDTIALGPVQMLATVSSDLTLRNTGDRLIDPTVVISGLQLDPAADFSLDRLEATAIGHGNQARGSVGLTPSSTGPREAVLSIDHSGPISPHLISVTGFGWRATDDVAQTPEDEGVVIAVLDNDGDPEGSVLTVFDVDRPSSGVATTDGLTITYQPRLNFNGEDTFGYRVRDSNGAVAEASVTVLVADVNDPPRANANGPYIGSTGVPVAFSSAGSSDPDGTFNRYFWTFGDGFSSAAPNPSHTYARPGAYTVVLRVTDDDGATAISSTSARIDARLSVEKSGDGFGTVVSSPAGINCGFGCIGIFVVDSSVIITATEGGGSAFTGWGGACAGQSGKTCTLAMTADRLVTATFTRVYALNLSKAGDGLGTVTSSPSGISCGADCTEEYLSGQLVTLAAAASPGSTFTGWSGGGCVGVGGCVVTMDAAKTVTATFQTNKLLSVAKSGLGLGTVTSLPGINCGLDCSELYAHGTLVTLTASPAIGSTFTGWSGGGCLGVAGCVVTMDAAKTVTATFDVATYVLSVVKAGSGVGTVTSLPGINCGLDCSGVYIHGTLVTLTASPAGGSTFTGWSGACMGPGACVVSMIQPQSVTATFQADQTLNVTVVGSGTVVSAPSGINCSVGTCPASYPFGTPVTLTPTPAVGWTFTGWSGGGCPIVGVCVVTMDAAKTVTATFHLG